MFKYKIIAEKYLKALVLGNVTLMSLIKHSKMLEKDIKQRHDEVGAPPKTIPSYHLLVGIEEQFIDSIKMQSITNISGYAFMNFVKQSMEDVIERLFSVVTHLFLFWIST